jgi:UDP:flavonoid glycosyltransferase YjiC (YdhE family)
LLGWSLTLRRRGHDVWLLGNQAIRAFAEREKFPFVDCDTPLLGGKPLESRSQSRLKVLRHFRLAGVDLLRRVYDAIAQSHLPGQTVMAAQGWLFGARVAQERLGIPLATVHLQPVSFRSIYEPGLLPGALGRGCRGLIQHLITRLVDRWFGHELNRFRDELGLAPVRGILSRWWRSPQLVLGMFPAWFAAPQPDWPAQTVLTGFPRFDEMEPPPNLDEVNAFLDAGKPPLVISSPTLFTTGADYLSLSAEIAQRVGRRAVLLSMKAETPAAALPAGVRYFGFVPLNRILPRAAAFIHHGGMGSIGQALAAGVPQLTVPRFLDQPNNSRHLQRLGVSVLLPPRDYRPDRVAERLGPLLESTDVRARCAEYVELCRQEATFDTASAALERLL